MNQMMQMQNMMFEMQKQLKSASGAPVPPPGPNPTPTPSNRSRCTRYYCWTHGWCFHAGKLCRAKAEGHKDEATKENRMNGSNKGCTGRFGTDDDQLDKINLLNNLSTIIPSVVPPKPIKPIIAKADSGASKHYFTMTGATTLHHCSKTNGPTVHLPNGDTISASMQGFLPFSKLTKQAQLVHVFPDLHSTSLISLGQLCDDGCTIVLTDKGIFVFKQKEIILTGTRNHRDGLWDIPLHSTPVPTPLPSTEQKIKKHALNVIISKNQTKSDLIHYLHACCFSPPKSTFLKAIKNGNFLGWPGLTVENVTRNLVIPPATAKGHLNQEKQHLQSTKNTELLHQIDDDTDFFPLPDTTPPIRTNNIMPLVVPFRERNTTYSDQTGRFPHISSRGNAYLLIVYDYDSNAILVEPLKSRAAAGIKNAWLKINTFLESRGRKPDLHILIMNVQPNSNTH